MEELAFVRDIMSQQERYVNKFVETENSSTFPVMTATLSAETAALQHAKLNTGTSARVLHTMVAVNVSIKVISTLSWIVSISLKLKILSSWLSISNHTSATSKNQVLKD